QFLEQRNTIPAACVVHTRSVLEQAGFWPENVPAAADWVLWRRMIACGGGRAAYLREPTNLHFSADWKRSRFAGIEEMRTPSRHRGQGGVVAADPALYACRRTGAGGAVPCHAGRRQCMDCGDAR